MNFTRNSKEKCSAIFTRKLAKLTSFYNIYNVLQRESDRLFAFS